MEGYCRSDTVTEISVTGNFLTGMRRNDAMEKMIMRTNI